MIRRILAFAAVWAMSLSCIIYAQDRGWASSIDWSPDGQTIAVGGGAGVWFFDNYFNELGYMEVGNHIHPNLPRFVEWNAKGDLLAFSGLDGPIEIIDVNMREVINEIYLNGFHYVWTEVQWHPQENLIIAGSYHGTTHIWDAITGEEQFHFDSLEHDPDSYWPATLGFCWFIEEEVVIVTKQTTYVVNIPENEILKKYTNFYFGSEAIRCNRHYLILSPEGQMYGLEPYTDDMVFDRNYYRQNAHKGAGVAVSEAVAWSPDSDRVVVTFGDCHIHVYRVNDGDNSDLLAEMPGGNYEMYSTIFFIDSVAWSPDGGRFAAVGQFGDIRVWDAKTYELLQRFDGFEAHPDFLGRYDETEQLNDIGCP